MMQMQNAHQHAPVAVVERASAWPIMAHAYRKTPKTITFLVTNLGKQPVRGCAGVVRVFDLIGNEIVDVSLVENGMIQPNKSVLVGENYTINQGNDMEKFFTSTDNKSLTYVYLPQRVVDERGNLHYVRAVSPSSR